MFHIKINTISAAKSPNDSTITVKIQIKWWVINYGTIIVKIQIKWWVINYSTTIVKIQIKWWVINYCNISK